MSKEIILKKLEQLKGLLAELERLLGMPEERFMKDLVALRAAERNFELIVETASDVNTQLLLETGKGTPDTYKQSFLELEKEGVIPKLLAEQLVITAKIRNILVHEYDFEADYARFYRDANAAVPAYKEYSRIILGRLPK